MEIPPASEKKLNRNQVLMLIILGSFLVGAFLGAGVVALVQDQQSSSKISALRESDFPTARSEYKFIDPIIGIKGVNDTAKYSEMKAEVSAYIADQKKNGLVTASVDFRDINEPGGFVLNPSEEYTPASLNKVPVMMVYFKIAETNPTFLSQEIQYPGGTNHNSIEEIRSAVQLTPGKNYTVEQLIEHMIRYSDNNAVELLTQHLKDTNNLPAFTTEFGDLGIDPSVLTHYTDDMTVDEYSIFLRALYNATYLNRADSERALQLLSETDFAEGIESGVPNNILVAEKFGEVRMVDQNGTFLGKQINNCGIIYYPSHPYLLCVMTKAKGDDIKGLESEIASISRIIYTNMENLYP